MTRNTRGSRAPKSHVLPARRSSTPPVIITLGAAAEGYISGYTCGLGWGSAGFSSHLSNLGRYDATYGSLSAVVALLFYLFVSSAVLPLGAEFNAQVYRARAAGGAGKRTS